MWLADHDGFGCISALKALADETRLRMLRLLLKEQLSINENSIRPDTPGPDQCQILQLAASFGSS